MSTPSFGSSEVPADRGGEGGGIDEMAGQAQERAQALAEQARVRAQEEVERRSRELGERARGTAEDLRDVAEHLRSQGKETPARAAEQAAERISGVGQYLQRTDGDQILHDIEAFGRRRPLALIAGGAAVGLVASRFLKASSTERYRRVQTGEAGPALRRYSAYSDPTSSERIG